MSKLVTARPPGSLCTYAESKEALLHLVFLHGLGLLPEGACGVAAAQGRAGETFALLERVLGETPVLRIEAALAQDEPVDLAQELRGIVEERYNLIERYVRPPPDACLG